MSDATTAAAAANQASPDEGQAANQQQVVQMDSDTNMVSEPDSAIPEKFVGKSPLDIIRSYQEAERTIGRLGSEKAHASRELDEARRSLASLQQQYAQSQQVRAQAQSQAQGDPDPLQVFDERFSDNPKEAIAGALKAMQQKVFSGINAMQAEQQARATASKYEELKRNNPDVAELEPEMVRLSQQLAPLIRPEKVNSPETLENLYLLAKARNLDKIAQSRAQVIAQKNGAVRTEKQRAFSESSNSQGGTGTKDFASLTKEQMRAMLGVSDK